MGAPRGPDGRFRNLNPTQRKTTKHLLQWWLGGGRARWPDHVPLVQQDAPPARVTGDQCRASYINHATALIQLGGYNIITDPVFSARVSPSQLVGPKRVQAPGVPLAQLPPLDLILISHNHYDHMDIPALKQLLPQHPNAEIVTPLGNDIPLRKHLGAARIHVMDWGETLHWKDCTISCTPLQHWSRRTYSDTNQALWAGFVVRTAAGAIYFAGDSGYGDGAHFRMIAPHAPRLAILPIGAYEPRWFMTESHMNPDEAVRAFRDTGAAFALAHHFNTFQLTNEAREAPVQALAEALVHHDVPPERFRALDNGAHWFVP